MHRYVCVSVFIAYIAHDMSHKKGKHANKVKNLIFWTSECHSIYRQAYFNTIHSTVWVVNWICFVKWGKIIIEWQSDRRAWTDYYKSLIAKQINAVVRPIIRMSAVIFFRVHDIFYKSKNTAWLNMFWDIYSSIRENNSPNCIWNYIQCSLGAASRMKLIWKTMFTLISKLKMQQVRKKKPRCNHSKLCLHNMLLSWRLQSPEKGLFTQYFF